MNILIQIRVITALGFRIVKLEKFHNFPYFYNFRNPFKFYVNDVKSIISSNFCFNINFCNSWASDFGRWPLLYIFSINFESVLIDFLARVGKKRFDHHSNAYFTCFRLLSISFSLWSEISKVMTEYLVLSVTICLCNKFY